jgi:hypothetical protein
MSFAAGDTNLSRYVGNTATQLIDPLGLAEIGPGYSEKTKRTGIILTTTAGWVKLLGRYFDALEVVR